MSDEERDPNLSLYHAIEIINDGDTRQRLSALEIIQSHVDTHTLGRDELNALTDAVVSLLKDNNFKVCVGALRVASIALAQAGDHSKAMAPLLVPALIERLGDGKAAVRKGALEAIFVIIDGLHSPTIVHERFASCWRHKNSHIREGILKIAIHCFKEYGAKFTSSKRKSELIKDVLHLLGDSTSTVRETAMSCVEAAYSVLGNSLRSALKEHGLRSAHMKEINSRLDQIQAPVDGPPSQATGSTATPQSSSSPTSSRTKRGGFGDGGGVTTDGTMADADPIHIKSSHELQNALEDIKVALADTTENWQARMQHMMRLEGIILGNDKKFDMLVQSLNHMKTCFIEQVLDRRSAVSRQACHLLTVISEKLGSSADSIVEHLVPVLFKVVVISVQVQADAAHCAVKRMMKACHVGKLVTQISNNLRTSRNAKLRCACIDYFHVILESWLKPEYDHYVANFESGLKSALSDASKDVRARARETFVMYKTEWPEEAAALFETLSSSVQKAIAQPGKKKRATKSARQSIRSQQLKSDFAAQLADSEAAGDQNATIFWPKKQPDVDHGEAGAKAGGDLPKSSVAGGALRLSSESLKTDKSKPGRKKHDNHGVKEAEKAPAKRHSSGFSFRSYLDSVSSQNLTWNMKVEKNTSFRDWVLKQGQGIVSELSSDIEKLVFVFVDHFHDPHHKVALSSLSLFEAVLPLCLHILEPFIEKFCPPLFLKMVDTKEQIRSSASEILVTVGERYSVETLIPALTRSLKVNKHPRSRIASLEFSVKYFRKSTVTSGSVLEGWIALIGPLICEKVVEVRRAAAAALVRVYQSVDAEPVLAYILSLSPREQSMVRKAVHSFVGSIDEELASYAASQNIHNLCWLEKPADDKSRKSVDQAEDLREMETVTRAESPHGGVTKSASYRTESDSNTSPEKTDESAFEGNNDEVFGQKSRAKDSRSPFALREKSYNLELQDSGSDVEMHDLSVILVNLGKCNLKQDFALKQFSTLARKYPSSVWEVFIGDTMAKLLDYMQASVPGVKACALLAVKQVACHLPELLSDSLDSVISLALQAVGEAHLEVKQSAEECLLALASSSNAEYAVQLLLDRIPYLTEDPQRNASLVSSFRAIGKALAKLSQSHLDERLVEVLPPLFSSFNSPDADVRKAVVFCLVDIYASMGNALMVHLSPLSTAQLKLLTIYIQRSKQGKGASSKLGGKENSIPTPTYV
ncbi:CLIP-associated protein [Chloropicon primus]|nr:CLIP-associated protein [Chloropicon primus]